MRAHLLLLPLVAACSSGGLSAFNEPPPTPPTDTATETGELPTDNAPPVADAGDPIQATAGQVVVLDGTASFDPDGDVLGYAWQMVEAPAGWTGSILQANRAEAQLYADMAGSFVAQLTVDDGLSTATATVSIDVAEPNDVPVANAGPDRYAQVGERVYLDGTSSYDPEGDAINYQWTLIDGPASSGAQLANASLAQPHLTPDRAGAYTLQLIVTDSAGNASFPDTARVIAEEGSSGGGGLFGCLSCGAAQRQLSARDAAGVPLTLAFPWMLVMLRRRSPAA